MNIGTERLHDSSLFVILKQYILQIGTFIDSSMGISFLFKVYYSILDNSLFSSIVAIILTIAFYINFNSNRDKVNLKLVLSLVFVLLFAFGIFSLTGFYPQIAFNLGDRVTIFGSLLISYLIVILVYRANRVLATAITAVFIFSILGLSNHWKEWNQEQLKIIGNISKNKDIRAIPNDEVIFVSHNQYSKLGELSHIEFFAEGIPQYIFKVALNKDLKISTINKRFIYSDSKLIDTKYNTSYNVKNFIYVYDSLNNKVLKIEKEDINKYIASLPKDNRHWIQLLDKDSFITKVVLYLMPRLQYAFN